MSAGWLVLAEGIMVFGGLIAFCVWQLRQLKRLEREDGAEPGLSTESRRAAGGRSAQGARHAERQEGSDPGGGEAVER